MELRPPYKELSVAADVSHTVVRVREHSGDLTVVVNLRLHGFNVPANSLDRTELIFISLTELN